MKKIFLKLIAPLLLIGLIYACGSSKTAENSDTGKLTLNVRAMYQIEDSVYAAKGNMINKLSIQNKNNPTGGTVLFSKGEEDEIYIRGADFFGPLGIYEIELIDYTGLMLDSLITPSEYGVYTINMPIVLDKLSAAEIGTYRKNLSDIGRVDLDK